ncbi:MAG: hypothetical protein Q8O14_04495 [bacterium]|jgi:hypothetical protein|nr:hypothetical protein [bacterium]
MKAMPVWLVGCLLAIACSCGHHSEIRVKASESYVRFFGNLDGVAVSIDSADFVSIAEFKSKHVLATSPGRHVIEVRRNGETIVLREVLLSNGTTLEIQIP